MQLQVSTNWKRQKLFLKWTSLMTFHSFYRRRRNNCLLNCRVDRKAAKFYKTLNLLRALYNKIREEEGSSRVETGKGMCHRRASAAHNMCSLKLACSLELLWGCPVLKIKFFGSTLVLHSNVSSSYLVFEQSQKLIKAEGCSSKTRFQFFKDHFFVYVLLDTAFCP